MTCHKGVYYYCVFARLWLKQDVFYIEVDSVCFLVGWCILAAV